MFFHVFVYPCLHFLFCCGSSGFCSLPLEIMGFVMADSWVTYQWVWHLWDLFFSFARSVLENPCSRESSVWWLRRHPCGISSDLLWPPHILHSSSLELRYLEMRLGTLDKGHGGLGGPWGVAALIPVWGGQQRRWGVTRLWHVLRKESCLSPGRVEVGCKRTNCQRSFEFWPEPQGGWHCGAGEDSWESLGQQGDQTGKS